MIVAAYLVLIPGPIILWLCHTHASLFGGANPVAFALLGFLVTNVLICFWELCLCYKYSYIRGVYEQRAKDDKALGPIIVAQQLPLRRLLSPTFWSYIWIDYARYDPSYADNTTAGYNIDVGNGHSTLAPSLFLIWSALWPVCGAKETAMVGLLLYYQTFYGTLVYLYSFFNVGRHKKCTLGDVLVKVMVPNSIWIVFPLLGMWASYTMIMTDSFKVLQ
eukprot:TRINITY_DN22905_c0_g1_i1.p1 TRINITY_DN22905_c0_g1~~TRINITY_DN22905_c0_g1_i1.p1  ORF type:complete len:230 (+),score=67.86 TRINITY_DN22905_c0_g1_i1:34-690(+)